MIRKILKALVFIIPTLLFAPAESNAQDISGYPLGYCNGEFIPTAIIKFNGSDVLVSGAIYIGPSYASTVVGNQLKTIRVGIGSTRNVSDVSVWVRKDLDGADLAVGGPAASFIQGWNSIDLDTPLTITSDLASEGFYIGYSFMQSFKSAGLAALSTPSEGGMWVKCGDDAWEDHSAEGTLCLEGLVYGSTLPRLNVHVEGVTVDKWYIVDQGLLNGVITVRNLATETVTSLTIEGKIEGIDSPCSTVVDCDIPYNEVAKVPFIVYPGYVSDEEKEISGVFTVTAVNGEQDEDVTDNSASTTFNVIMKAYPRKVLLEEFTTTSCSNCPRMAGYIHEMLADPQYANVVEVVCHHTGFGTDEYTLPGVDEQYNWFYNAGGSTYAPAIMLDRAYSRYPETPVFLPSSVLETEAFVDKRLAEPSVVSLEIQAERNGNNIDVTVSGNVLDMQAFCENPRITVYLVEDNIMVLYQAGAGPGYVIQHTTRAVNSTWGDALDFDADNNYTYTCSLPYSDSYKWEDMSVVAMIGNINLDNPMDCVVENSGSISLVDAAGVGSLESEGKEDVIFTIDGYRINKVEVPGLYIINGKKVLVRN